MPELEIQKEWAEGWTRGILRMGNSAHHWTEQQGQEVRQVAETVLETTI